MGKTPLVSDEQIMSVIADITAEKGVLAKLEDVIAACRDRYGSSGNFERVGDIRKRFIAQLASAGKSKSKDNAGDNSDAKTVSVLTADDSAAIDEFKATLIEVVDKHFSDILAAAIARHHIELEKTSAAEIAVAESDSEGAITRLGDANDRIAELEAENKEAIKGCARAEGEAKELRRQLEAASKRIEELEADARDVASAERERDDAKRAATDATDKLAAVEKRLERAEAETRDAREDAKNAVAEVKRQKETAIEEVKEEKRKAVEDAMAEVAKARDRAEILENKLLEIIEQRAAVSAQVVAPAPAPAPASAQEQPAKTKKKSGRKPKNQAKQETQAEQPAEK